MTNGIVPGSTANGNSGKTAGNKINRNQGSTRVTCHTMKVKM